MTVALWYGYAWFWVLLGETVFSCSGGVLGGMFSGPFFSGSRIVAIIVVKGTMFVILPG